MSATRAAGSTTRVADRPVKRAPSAWRGLLVAGAGASVVAFLGVAALLTDLEAAAYAGGFAVGLGLSRVRKGRVAVVVLGLLSLNVLGWTSLAVVSNLRSGQALLAVAIPAALAALALVALIAAVAELALGSEPGGSPVAARAVAVAAALAFLALVGAGALSGTDRPTSAEDGLVVLSNNVLFEPTELSATVGQVTVRMTNQDLFWHTFTIDELDVDLPVAVNGDRAVTFAAPAGAFEYYCRIPGHESRMRGTLVVTAPITEISHVARQRKVGSHEELPPFDIAPDDSPLAFFASTRRRGAGRPVRPRLTGPAQPCGDERNGHPRLGARVT